MHPDASEASMIRTYLDLMVDLPWAKSTTDKLDLKESQELKCFICKNSASQSTEVLIQVSDKFPSLLPNATATIILKIYC